MLSKETNYYEPNDILFNISKPWSHSNPNYYIVDKERPPQTFPATSPLTRSRSRAVFPPDKGCNSPE